MGNIGYEDDIRIGHESDALRLLDEMIGKCKIKPPPGHNDIERKIWEAVAIGNKYFLPRLEALRDALARDII
jgi:hypothetical protein